MQRSTLVIGFAATVVTGCRGDTTVDSVPYRDDWMVAHQAPFHYRDDSGEPQILTISIGGDPYMNNFANQGDVIVELADTDEITIEMRKFTMASDDTAAQADFDALHLWAYDASGNPKPPGQMDPADDCAHVDTHTGQARPWVDACRILVFYDGQTQLERAGADLRVTIPRAYQGKLDITTTDEDEDADYHNRGDVCIADLAGSAQVSMRSGRGYVRLASDITPTPTCAPKDVAACESWTKDDGTPAAWAPQCPCFAGGATFGQLTVDSPMPSAAEMTVDVPGDLWAAINLQVAATSASGDGCGAQCEASVTLPAYVPDPTVGDDPLHRRGVANYPGHPAVAAGYGIQLTTHGCAPVSSTESPDDFVGVDNGALEHTEEHGNLTACNGCLQGMSCEQILAAPVAHECG